jgi:hypothetical protein
MSSSSAIYCNPSYGPTFGYGGDICVTDGCNENIKSFANFGTSYENNTGLNGKEVFTGEYNFQVKEIEVFTITL